MFAVIQTGGKQYKVASSDTVLVEKLEGKAGDVITLDVVAIGSGKDVTIGAPLVSGAKVTAEIIGVEKGDKVLVFKKKRRQNYRRTNGHRQQFTKLFITGIADASGNKTEADQKRKPKLKTAEVAAPAKEKAAKPAAKKVAAPKPAAKKTAEKPAAEKKPAAKKAAAPKAEGEAKKPAAKKPAAKKTESKDAE